MFNELETIDTLAEAKAFASYLFFDCETVFHPEDDFNDYIDTHGKPTFSPERAAILNQRMSECRRICDASGVDVCEHMAVADEYFKAIADGVNADVARKEIEIACDGLLFLETMTSNTQTPKREI